MAESFSNEEQLQGFIAGAFLGAYRLASQEYDRLLDHYEQNERRADLAKRKPHAAQYLERHTREEIQTKLMILAIAEAVAVAVMEAHRNLQ